MTLLQLCVALFLLHLAISEPQGFQFGNFRIPFGHRRPGNTDRVDHRPPNRRPDPSHPGHQGQHQGQGQHQQVQNGFQDLFNVFGQAVSGTVVQRPNGQLVIDANRVQEQAGHIIGSLFGGGHGGQNQNQGGQSQGGEDGNQAGQNGNQGGQNGNQGGQNGNQGGQNGNQGEQNGNQGGQNQEGQNQGGQNGGQNQGGSTVPSYLDPEDIRQDNTHLRLCNTRDGLRGTCQRDRRCPRDRLALTRLPTSCGRRRRICCPSRSQESSSEGSNSGGGGSNQPGGGQSGSSGQGSNGGGNGRVTTTSTTTTTTTTKPSTTTTTTTTTTTMATTTTTRATTTTTRRTTTTTTTRPTTTTKRPTPAPLTDCGRPTPIKVAPAWLRNGRRKRAAQNGQFVPFIIGGVDAEVGKWPWIVLIGTKDDSSEPFWFCGGTLIDSQHILTAAHCLRPRTYNLQKLVIRLGEYDTTDPDDGTKPQDVPVERVTNHPGFQYPVLHDDISVVRLRRPVSFTNLIKPICLPLPSSGDYAGTRVDIAGWGYTEFGGTASNVLQEVNLPVVGIRECQTKYENTPSFSRQFPGGFGDTKLCAAEKDGGKDACQGDSGGPMVHQSRSGRYELLGVVSAGVGCGSPGFPGVYTRVNAYIDWINEHRV